jgi:dihydroneopterin aldolase
MTAESQTATAFELDVRDLELLVSIGVYPIEFQRPQRVRLSLSLTISDQPSSPDGNNHERAVCYDDLIRLVERSLRSGHIPLLETLVERLVGNVLSRFLSVEAVTVSAEKPDAQPHGRASIKVHRTRAEHRNT